MSKGNKIRGAGKRGKSGKFVGKGGKKSSGTGSRKK